MAGGMGKKTRKPLAGYMGGGKTKKPPMSKMYRGGGMTKDTTPSYKDYVQKMFGGGMTKKKLNYKDGGTTDPLIATNKRRKRTKKLQAELDKNTRNSITLGTKRANRPLDGKKSRGRKYDRSNAGTKFSDSKNVTNVI